MAAAPARKPATLPSPAELLDLIAQRKAELPELLRKQNDAAEQSIISGNEGDYIDAVGRVAALHREIERLQSAMIGATARTREAAEAQQRAVHAAQVERVSKLLEQRLPVAERIEKAIIDLVKGWHDLIEISDEALTVYPGGPPPSGLALSNSELIALVAGEMARLGNVPPITGRPVIGRQIPSLPAPRAPDFMLMGTPERITPLRVGLEQANQTARTHMEGRKDAA
jgi:hypothetical protein